MLLGKPKLFKQSITLQLMGIKVALISCLIQKFRVLLPAITAIICEEQLGFLWRMGNANA